MKKSNNAYVTQETIAYVNTVLQRCYNVELQDINRINIDTSSDTQKGIDSGWNASEIAGRAKINNIPVWMYRKIFSFLQNSYERRQLKTLSYINLDSGLSLALAQSDSSSSSFTVQANSKIRIDVPEGYNGNDSFVYFVVPTYVIQSLERYELNFVDTASAPYHWASSIYEFDWSTIAATRQHPLQMRPDIDDVGAFYTGDNKTHIHGHYRTDALLFYSRFLRSKDGSGTQQGGEIMIDYAQQKDFIDITYNTANLLPPFKADTGDEITTQPWVRVIVEFYRRGVQ